MQEVIDTFSEIYKKQGSSIFLDNYLLSEGTYFIAEKDECSIYEIKWGEPLDRENENIQFLILADFYSRLISMNKSVDKSKLIKSNNCYSLIINKKDLDKNDKVEKSLNLYYECLKEWAENDKENANINFIQELVKCSLSENIRGLSPDGRFKWFFKPEGWQEKYEKESYKYLSRNVFNATIKGQELLGVPFDININSKKPYLMNKSRKVEYPLLITLDEAIMRWRFFEFLRCCVESGRKNIYADDTRIIPLNDRQHLKDVGVFFFTGYYLRIDMGKNGVFFKDMDTICNPI